jgi:DNA-binding MarR family transcriptional regulator/GNAT superfamily N-acetyltransferase
VSWTVEAVVLEQRVAAIRRFNRFYTRLIGLLNEGYLDSPFTLTEVRVLYELAQRPPTTAASIGRTLGVDRGYLSRMLRRFGQQGLVARTPSPTDRRRQLLALTARGRRVFAGLDRRSHDQIAELLDGRLNVEQQRIVAAMALVERRLAGHQPVTAEYTLREPLPGDLGWVVERHGAVYAQEYGWDERFEALVAQIVADFGRRHDPARERCWIAELDGQNAGSVFCVQKSADVAQLRLLLVEPHARGLGIGRRLVDECVSFARSAGYSTLMLWTNDVLVGARRIYEAAGFRLVEEERHHSFGHDLVGQNWELAL